MKKRVLIIWDDYYHPEANYREAVRKSFDENKKWDVTKTHRIKDLFAMEPKPDLCIHFTVGCPEGEEGLTEEEEAKILEMAENGMGMLFIHAGLACIQDNTPFYELAKGRFASHPEPHYDIYCTRFPEATHPIVRDIEPFVSPDEHYFCKIDIGHVTPILAGVSEAGTEIAGWVHTVGAGRVCCLTQGHNHPMVIKMRPLIENAALWCVGDLN